MCVGTQPLAGRTIQRQGALKMCSRKPHAPEEKKTALRSADLMTGLWPSVLVAVIPSGTPKINTILKDKGLSKNRWNILSESLLQMFQSSS